MASLVVPALRNDTDLKRKTLAIWDKYEKAYATIRDDYIGNFLMCDNCDEATAMTKEFGKRTSKLLADALHKMKQCMASRITEHITNDYIRRIVDEFDSNFDQSSESE